MKCCEERKISSYPKDDRVGVSVTKKLKKEYEAGEINELARSQA